MLVIVPIPMIYDVSVDFAKMAFAIVIAVPAPSRITGICFSLMEHTLRVTIRADMNSHGFFVFYRPKHNI